MNQGYDNFSRIPKITPLPIDKGYMPLIFVKSVVTGQNLTKFTKQCRKIIAIEFLKLKWRYSNPLRNAMLAVIVQQNFRPILPILSLKLVTIATSLDRSEKGRMNKYPPYGENFVKIGQVDPEIIGLPQII